MTRSGLEAPLGELRLLLESLCDGELDGAGYARIEQLVRSAQAATDFYVDYLWLHGELRWQASPQQVKSDCEIAAPPAVPAGPAESAPTTAAQNPPPRPAPIGHLSWLVNALPARMLALGLLLILGGYFVVVMALIPLARLAGSNRLDRDDMAPRVASVSPPGADVGALQSDEHARWSRRSADPRRGRLRAGENYRLISGRVQMSMAKGARVCVEGPAEFEPQSGERVRLLRGRLVAFVPPAASGFTVATPAADVIDLGTEFGVEVDGDGVTDLHVIQGRVEVKPTDRPAAHAAGRGQRIAAGQAVRVPVRGRAAARIDFDGARFSAARSEMAAAAAPSTRPAQQISKEHPIWLGNLFDDPPRTPLAEAVRSDTFNATPASDTLGVSGVDYGQIALKEITPGLKFDLACLGWTTESAQHRVANDAYTHDVTFFQGQRSGGGIRLSGEPTSLDEPKMEEGIGMHANALITFDLDEIRTAGRLGQCDFEFVCDRAGVNDSAVGQGGSVHLAVLVIEHESVQTAWVDGAAVELDQREGHWFIASPIGDPLRADGRTVSFRVPVEANAQFLTLVASCAGDNVAWDHAVWLGARLELTGRNSAQQSPATPP